MKKTEIELECTVCKEKYIGETGRQLLDRVKEHESDIKYCNKRIGPWAVHARNHQEQTTFNTRILGVERNVHRRKILEALIIKEMKPNINRRAEMMDTVKYIAGSI